MVHFSELDDLGLISFTGEDAVPFLHAQLTSDVAGIGTLGTQYGGYCSPKGRLLATFLLWRLKDSVVLQLPAVLRETIQNRLGRYVLRAQVKVADATARYRLFGIDGNGASTALEALDLPAPASIHAVVAAAQSYVTRLPPERYLLLAPAERADAFAAGLENVATRAPSGHWTALDIAGGVAVITQATQEAYVPQMVNLDLVGGVSYSKGCYPGQEIVARTHYLGKLKQRMFRVLLRDAPPLTAGQLLYSPEFGGGQASGSIVSAGPRMGQAQEALAVVQRASVEGQAVRLGALDGPPVAFLPLPYTIPA